MTSNTKRLLAALAACMLLLAGCAGGGRETGSGAAAEGSPAARDPQSEPSPAREEEFELNGDWTNMLQYQEPATGTPIAVMATSMGEIRIALYEDIAPKAVNNFITHAREGYYDGMIFHRVIQEFMIQTGDPTGTGSGGQSVYTDADGNPTTFEDEFSDELWHFRGALSMANPGYANYNQSQFFIVQCTYNPYTTQSLVEAGFPQDVAAAYEQHGGTPHLDKKHSIFGMVIDGMDVVDAIAAVKTDAYVAPDGSVLEEPQFMETASNKPLEDVTILSVTIEAYGQQGGGDAADTTQ